MGMATFVCLTASAAAEQSVVVIVGAPGDDEYQQMFLSWADKWKAAADKSGATHAQIGGDENPEGQDRQRLFDQLREEQLDSQEPLWIVLIGHGTFDGRLAKFNLRGPDMSSAELAQQLKSFRRPLAIINCASASAPFINELSGPNRVVVTATKSGFQYNFARFGDYLADAITNPAADLDKDEQTSLLEAFLLAGARVGEFYENESRIATEEPVIDDNGDGLGTLAAWFRGVRATKRAKKNAPADGLRANQLCLIRSEVEQQLAPEARERRDELEAQLEGLRTRKYTLQTDEYYDRLELIFIELATLYAASSE
jgi:hypothetical protein